LRNSIHSIKMVEINFEDLKSVIPDLTESWAHQRFEAAIFCLDKNNHQSGVLMKLTVQNANCRLKWESQIDERIRNTWNDIQEATEKGAEGIASMLVNELTEYKVIQRSAKATGIDYWLGHKHSDALLFQSVARLEISGHIEATIGEFNQRIKDKKKQTHQSDSSRLPVYVSVTDFGQPRTHFEKL
jgi:hypothetical protein